MLNLYQLLKNFPDFQRQLTCGGMLFTQYECPQVEQIERFYIECNFIAYVISGRRVFHKNNMSWDVKEGVCAFVKKGAHTSQKEPGEIWCVMVFFLPDHFLKNIYQEYRERLPLKNLPAKTNDHVLPLDVSELSKSFFLSMLPYFQQTQPPPETLIELKFKELLLSLFSNPANSQLLSYIDYLSHDGHPSIEEVMHNNYTYNLTLEEYAKLSCKSVPTFKRDFKKIFNETPAKWVLKKRIELATGLLTNTSRSIADITYECGFENQTHFSRVFKEQMKKSPSQFRSQVQAAV